MNTEFTPYYAVIFTSIQTENIEGYAEMAKQMEDLAKNQAGFISIDSARNAVGITVSYWESLEAIKHWKQHTDHLIAQQKGIKDWYAYYNVKICKVEREYSFNERS
ncbi:antibiotic biosynthesis monooxygenase [Kordia sp. YSTF-M3]|uniref:Antibiotic biosynthesis monooxygenase n=1 Tax=Kordia aestuariivivens TaxID=2759037 RepID=A0ABR7Q736_9FLAO|nr:antibiotic biosynthesis monooxygenase [Kordia aestuariivivens]MBC8754144.1 antibiotic biosynthesis monooxygenase [Kordia aestuariivivens]